MLHDNFAKEVQHFLDKPILNPLTPEEGKLAIAIFGVLKNVDHSWNIQEATTYFMSLQDPKDLKESKKQGFLLAYNNLKAIPSFMREWTSKE